MNSALHVPLNLSAEQLSRLRALQEMFAQACNTLAVTVQQTRTWNRVALHHLAYKQIRERFPALGSQMACNAIYSVSRAARQVYQSPASPFRLQKLGDRPLPRLQFTARAPVFFDRHTLSLRGGVLSMFTLDGRMKFSLGLAPRDEQRFREEKLREIVLSREGERFVLIFAFGAEGEPPPDRRTAPQSEAEWPEYVLVQEVAAASRPPNALPAGSPAPALSQPLTPLPR